MYLSTLRHRSNPRRRRFLLDPESLVRYVVYGTCMDVRWFRGLTARTTEAPSCSAICVGRNIGTTRQLVVELGAFNVPDETIAIEDAIDDVLVWAIT